MTNKKLEKLRKQLEDKRKELEEDEEEKELQKELYLLENPAKRKVVNAILKFVDASRNIASNIGKNIEDNMKKAEIENKKDKGKKKVEPQENSQDFMNQIAIKEGIW